MSLYNLVAKLTLDTSGYDKGIEDSKSKISSLGSAVTKGVGTLAKVGVAGVTAATTAVGVLAKKSLDGYGQYQQMVGGVQKLYGNMGMSLDDYAKSVGKSTTEVQGEWSRLEKAQNMVLENAQNAYKTSGMSANQYMEMATSFSASLINSLGGDTVAAAEKTDVAMRAISDNWNTFGGDIGSIQYAFQGFAKQNYAMLDNLKLGYGGTASEMVKLIKDSGILGDAADDLTAKNLNQKVSFAQIVDAIQVVQEKQHIAGTTSREAASTIEGSLGSVRAAWDNLVTGFADPKANLSELIQNVITTGASAVSNLLPTFTQALSGIVTAIEEILPQALEKIPYVIDNMVVPLFETGVKLVGGLISGLQENSPAIMESIIAIFDKLSELTPQILEAGGKLASWIGEGLVTGIPTLVEAVMHMLENFTSFLAENAGSIIEAGMNLLNNILQGIMDALPKLIEYIPTIIENLYTALINALPKILEGGMQLLLTLQKGLLDALPKLIEAIPKIVKSMFDAFVSFDWLGLGKKIIIFIGQGVIDLVEHLPKILMSIGKSAYKIFTDIDWLSVGKNIIIGIGKGIIKFAGSLVDAAVDAAKDAVNAVKNWLGIASPSKRARDEIGKWMALGVGKGWEKYMPVDDMQDTMQDAVDSIRPVVNDAYMPDDSEYIVSTSADGSGAGSRSAFAPVLNIYASDGQDVEELAQIIMDRLAFEYDRQGSVFA